MAAKADADAQKDREPPGLKPTRAFTSRTRTLQFRGRRTSVRLENVFWEYLDQKVRQQGIRLGTMIGRLAQDFPGGNLSSHLRAACMLDALQAAGAPAARMASARQNDPQATTATEAFHLTPAPGLLVSDAGTVLEANTTLLDWLRRPKEGIQGASLGSLLRLQQGQSFERYWEGLRSTRTPSSSRMALVTLPGRLAAAEITMVRLAGPERSSSQYIVWFKTGSTVSPQRKTPQ